MKTKHYKYPPRWSEHPRKKPTLSDFILPIEKVKHRRAVIYARVSNDGQEDNLPDQINKVKTELEKRGILVVAIFSEIAKAADEISAEESKGRNELFKAILKAYRNDCVVVAESVDRFRRCWMSKENKKKHGQRPLDNYDVEKLMEEAEGVPLATIVDPDALPDKGEIRSYQTLRGQSGKGKKGGRPRIKTPKKNQRLKNKDRAIALRAAGKGWGAISKALGGVSRSTIRGWIASKKPHT